MVFVGKGALLKRAVRHAMARGVSIDLVFTTAEQDLSSGLGRQVRLALTRDISRDAARLRDACRDGVVWSINNNQIFGSAVLRLPVTILNVHNGLLPEYRGLGHVAMLFALLNGEREYGATLHLVDEGIDTGAVLDEIRYPIEPDDDYQAVMFRGLDACQTLFERNLGCAGARHSARDAAAQSDANAAYYGSAALSRLGAFVGHHNFRRATALGMFAETLPDLAAALAALPSTGTGR